MRRAATRKSGAGCPAVAGGSGGVLTCCCRSSSSWKRASWCLRTSWCPWCCRSFCNSTVSFHYLLLLSCASPPILSRAAEGKRGILSRPPAHNKDMRKNARTDIDPIDQMIQANKDEADSTLSLWGKKARKHPKPKSRKKL